jgi:hypothetical protein
LAIVAVATFGATQFSHKPLTLSIVRYCTLLEIEDVYYRIATEYSV